MKHIKLFESYSQNIKIFIKENGFTNNGKYKDFVYHATNKELDDFYLDSSLDYEEIDGNNIWDIDMPSGYLFLTTDLKEASVYGRYVIPFEINTNDILTIEVESNAPSRVFDDDYNYGTEYNMWQKFAGELADDIYDCLEVKGYDKSTFVCYIDSLTPRIDIAKKYYNK
jgi:hypothetical protein